MKSQSVLLIKGVIFAAIITGLAGCIVVKVNLNDPKHAAGMKPCCAGGAHPTIPEPAPNDPWPAPVPRDPIQVLDPTRPFQVFDPTGNSGYLTVPVNSFTSGDGGQTCFPTSEGWDRYFTMPRYLLGPNVTPDAMSYTNISQLTNATVRTCLPANGTSLETGIVIYEEFNPSTDKVCKTNSPACLASTKLTINQRPIASGLRYRATVFYKSSTIGSRTNVTFLWSYP